MARHGDGVVSGTTHEETWTDYDGFVSFKEKNTILITPSEE